MNLSEPEFLKDRVKQIFDEFCSDYPQYRNIETWEQLHAIEGSLRGTNAAVDDMHKVVKAFQLRCGMTTKELIEFMEEAVDS